MTERTRPCSDCGAPNLVDEQRVAQLTALGYDATAASLQRCTVCHNDHMVRRLNRGLQRWAYELVEEASRRDRRWRVEEWNWKYDALDIRPWPSDEVVVQMTRELEHLSAYVCPGCGREWGAHRRSTCLWPRERDLP